MLLLPWYLIFSISISPSAALDFTLPADCPCGYVDRVNDRLFTESTIVYFNETQAIDPNVFINRSFENKKQKGWSSTFRRGASPSNVDVSTMSNLELSIDPSTPDHLVDGAELRTVRQDIQYGSFRVSMRSPSPNAGGSALSMTLKYNDSESLQLDLLNMDSPQQARITNLVNGELPAEDNVFSYTALQGGLGGSSPEHPWDFMDYRIDWTDYEVAFWAGETVTRKLDPKNQTLPFAPQPLSLSHWSTGDLNYMQGPPAHQTEATVVWIRTFFNSSLMTKQEHLDFDGRCKQWMACSMEDPSLRGSSPYGPAATKAYKKPPANQKLRIPAAFVAGICSSFGIFALANALIRVVPWHKLGRSARKGELGSRETQTSPAPSRPSCESERGLVDPAEPAFLFAPKEILETGQSTPYRLEVPPENLATGQSTPYTLEIFPPGHPWRRSDSQAPTDVANTPHARSRPISIEPYIATWNTSSLSSTPYARSRHVSAQPNSEAVWNTSTSRVPSFDCGELAFNLREKLAEDDIMPIDPGVGVVRLGAPHYPPFGKDVSVISLDEKKSGLDMGMVTAVSPGSKGAALAVPAQKRLDYLAGLVAFSCLLVSIRHFTLTFWPYVAMGYGDTKHYAWEHWTYIFLGGYFLTPLWFGPFFITSSRFLSSRYLREGDLADVAKKLLLRGPRLLVPVAIVALLEYFFISLGFVAILTWLPSISWSTWPYVTPQDNFGVFVNNIVELAYYIPVGAPEITGHFCVGVLWTIPVQLQYSYVVLLSAVIVRDMKTPWKRFGYYACCVGLGWYARSWSACFWIGVLLTDLEVTYDWKNWTQSRPWVLYPVLTAATAVLIGTPLLLVFNIQYSFMINERGIHPDIQTGLSLADTPRGGYPEYYEPTLAILLFSTAIQIIADLSTWAQKFLSIRPLVWMRPHIMTIYLVHGIIFWSLGAWLCVTLSVAGVVPYWANLMITFLICYIVIAFVTAILTPLMDFTTRSATKNIWRWATEEPVPKIPTTGKFSKALVLDRSESSPPATGV